MLRHITTILTLAAITGTLFVQARAADTGTPGNQLREESNNDLISLEQIHQKKNPLGGIDYYTGEGSYLGRSLSEGVLGISFYDPAGIKQGYSTKNSRGGWDYFNRLGHKLGHSLLTAAGGYELFDSLGLSLGFTFESSIGYFNYFLKKNPGKRALLPGQAPLGEELPGLAELFR